MEIYKKGLLFLLTVFIINIASSQSKAYVLQNWWSNSLNEYNPSEFYQQVFTLLQKKLKVKELDRKPFINKQDISENELKDMANKHAKETGQPAYYIALSTDLALPTFNLTRIIFKVPTRSTRLAFTVNVFNSKSEKILSDTIVSKGCIIKVVDKDKLRNFYPDYATFTKDMNCHFEAIRKEIEEK